MLPIVWEGDEAGEIALSESPTSSSACSSRRSLCGHCVSVRLGSSGNGFVVFTGDF